MTLTMIVILFLLFLISLVSFEKIYQHSRQCSSWPHFQKTSKFIKNTPQRSLLYLWLNAISRLIYYLKAKGVTHIHTRTSKQSFRLERLKTVSWGSSKEKIRELLH